MKNEKKKRKKAIMDAVEMAKDVVGENLDGYTNAKKLNRIQNRFTSSIV